MREFLWVGLGGACGTWARYLTALAMGPRAQGGFPWATLAVNLVGCFLMGLLLHLSARLAGVPPVVRLALGTGFLGGLTTYSSFNAEVLELARDGLWGSAAWYFGSTTAACIAAGLSGLWAASRAVGA